MRGAGTATMSSTTRNSVSTANRRHADTTRKRTGRTDGQNQQAIDDEPSDDPIFEGLRLVLKRNEIPARYPLELLKGFEMDAARFSYRTLEDTLEYCYYVAGVVGVMMAYIMGARDEDSLNRAADLGIAFQLTNISRDVREDAEIGRIYLPGEWLSEAAGIPAARDSASRSMPDALVGVIKRLLNRSRSLLFVGQRGPAGTRLSARRGPWPRRGSSTGPSANRCAISVRRHCTTASSCNKGRKILGVAEGMIDATMATLISRHTEGRRTARRRIMERRRRRTERAIQHATDPVRCALARRQTIAPRVQAPEPERRAAARTGMSTSAETRHCARTRPNRLRCTQVFGVSQPRSRNHTGMKNRGTMLPPSTDEISTTTVHRLRAWLRRTAQRGHRQRLKPPAAMQATSVMPSHAAQRDGTSTS